jgi:hypothetical protein
VRSWSWSWLAVHTLLVLLVLLVLALLGLVLPMLRLARRLLGQRLARGGELHPPLL